MGCFSIFLHCSIITRQVNEISGRIAQIITFVSLSSPTSIVYSVFCLFFFFLVNTCFFLQLKQTLLLMVLEISEVHVIGSISCEARETDA